MGAYPSGAGYEAARRAAAAEEKNEPVKPIISMGEPDFIPAHESWAPELKQEYTDAMNALTALRSKHLDDETFGKYGKQVKSARQRKKK